MFVRLSSWKEILKDMFTFKAEIYKYAYVSHGVFSDAAVQYELINCIKFFLGFKLAEKLFFRILNNRGNSDQM
jgi:hypothetical protein